MLIKKRTGIEIPSSEITPKDIYLSRRKFMTGAAALTAAAALAACSPNSLSTPEGTSPTAEGAALATGEPSPTATTATTDELGDDLTSFTDVTNYNNYYEFTLEKEKVAEMAAGYPTSPWQVEVGGLVRNPGVYSGDDFRNNYDQEERIYRLRCVEGWSMVIPWQGFPLAKLLQEVEPMSEAKYVRFETILDPEKMPGQRSPWYEWP
jgi:sulfoxide reductase catalytic subunit YedY